MAEESAIVSNSMTIMILLSIMRWAGVCLSLSAFLKSFTIELKARAFVELEEKFDGAKDIWLMFVGIFGPALAKEAKSFSSEFIAPELFMFI